MKGIINYINDDDFKLLMINKKININNYTNILSMTDTRISLISKIGRIVIKGEDLIVKKLINNEVLIEGNISSIEIGDKDV